MISDDSNLLDTSLLDELLANIATLSSVYHKPPDAFVTRVKTVQRTEDDDFPDGGEAGYSESPSHAPGASPPASSSSSSYAVGAQPASTAVVPAGPAPVPDLLDLMGLEGDNSSNALVSVDQPAETAG